MFVFMQVMHLKERLEEEEAVTRTLRAAFDGSIVSLPSLSSLFLPPQAIPINITSHNVNYFLMIKQ